MAICTNHFGVYLFLFVFFLISHIAPNSYYIELKISIYFVKFVQIYNFKTLGFGHQVYTYT